MCENGNSNVLGSNFLCLASDSDQRCECVSMHLHTCAIILLSLENAGQSGECKILLTNICETLWSLCGLEECHENWQGSQSDVKDVLFIVPEKKEKKFPKSGQGINFWSK